MKAVTTPAPALCDQCGGLLDGPDGPAAGREAWRRAGRCHRPRPWATFRLICAGHPRRRWHARIPRRIRTLIWRDPLNLGDFQAGPYCEHRNPVMAELAARNARVLHMRHWPGCRPDILQILDTAQIFDPPEARS